MTNVKSALARFWSAADLLEDYERPTSNAPATPEHLALFEAAIGDPLPPDARDFFQAHDSISAMDVHNGYSIGGSAILTRSVSRGDFPTKIDSWSVFPIGSDGGGNAFLATVAEGGPVWKWRHDVGLSVWLAGSLAEFFGRLADDVRAFADGETDWDFMAG
jgi:hypothetical protein